MRFKNKTLSMIKNYTRAFEKQNLRKNPKKETISFLLNYSKSFEIYQQGNLIKNLRLDKN